MAYFDVGALVTQITNEATAIVGKDIKLVAGFSEQQLEGLAAQAALLADGIATGRIRPALQDYFLDSLKQSAANLLRVLVGVVLVTLEKLWNAVVGALWDALSKATGLGFIAPLWGASGLAK
ncbi:hypothetical protein [Niveispirillum fermenti]|uniref:hypothetical protein n=1 Tax=Niveispirillum fermenti TaxID=1233113 RepID=UPI003A8C8787